MRKLISLLSLGLLAAVYAPAQGGTILDQFLGLDCGCGCATGGCETGGCDSGCCQGGCSVCQQAHGCGWLKTKGHGCGGSGCGAGDCGQGGCGHCKNRPEGLDRYANCNCNGSYNYPVPPLYTYHWPGMFKAQRMTDYHSPYRFPPIRPYTDEVPIQPAPMQAAGGPQEVRPVVAYAPVQHDSPAPAYNLPVGEAEPISRKLLRQAYR